MKLDVAIQDVRNAEAHLAKRLRVVGERHAVEHDLYHLGHTLARHCSGRLDRLLPFAGRYGASHDRDEVSESPTILERIRHKSAELVGRSEVSGMLLLRDLRDLYLAAQEAEMAWLILSQGAQAVRDRELLEVTTVCHEQAEAVGKWLRTRIKQSAPQVLATK